MYAIRSYYAPTAAGRSSTTPRITSYNVCYTKLLRGDRWVQDKVEFEVQSVERQRVVRVLVRGLTSVAPLTAEDGRAGS